MKRIRLICVVDLSSTERGQLRSVNQRGKLIYVVVFEYTNARKGFNL